MISDLHLALFQLSHFYKLYTYVQGSLRMAPWETEKKDIMVSKQRVMWCIALKVMEIPWVMETGIQISTLIITQTVNLIEHIA